MCSQIYNCKQNKQQVNNCENIHSVTFTDVLWSFYVIILLADSKRSWWRWTCGIYITPWELGDFDPAGSDVSGAHTLCLFGFCPASNINRQTHYHTYCIQVSSLRAGHCVKRFEMSVNRSTKNNIFDVFNSWILIFSIFQ